MNKKLSPEEKAKIKQEKTEKKLKIQKQREEAKKKNPRSEEKFYVTNKALMAEMIKWRDSAEKVEDRVISEELGRMIIEIATRMTNHSRFRFYGQDIKSDMISYSCFKIVQGLKNYNFKFKNVFAYMTQAVYNACLGVCAKHYKQINIKRELLKNSLSQLECAPGVDQNKIINTYIKSYLGEDDEENPNSED